MLVMFMGPEDCFIIINVRDRYYLIIFMQFICLIHLLVFFYTLLGLLGMNCFGHLRGGLLLELVLSLSQIL
jgi:hypothetical protein